MPFAKGQGGRKPGSKNKLTLAKQQLRQEALRKLNEDLPEDAFDGDAIALFQRIYKDPTFDPELRLEAAAKIAQFERKEPSPDAAPKYIAVMPPLMPGKDSHQQLAVWWALYGETPGNDPEFDADAKRLLDRVVTKPKPETLSS